MYGLIKDQKLKFLFLLLFISVTSLAGVQITAQQVKKITGTVTDANIGGSLPGVTVLVEGTQNGTLTDVDGKYSIDAAQNAVLVFSYVGYVTQKITVGNLAVIDVKLAASLENLQEVVVVGFGTQKKQALTGSVASVTANEIALVHGGSTVSSNLAGKISGVSFRMADGRPGTGASIQVRNLGTPLYVIDGIQKDATQFNNLAPDDIESISVLKDASASVYGSRAANGVIIVTTKRGITGGKSTININAYTGWQNFTRYPKMANAYEWTLYKAYADMNYVGQPQGMTIQQNKDEIAKWKAGTEPGYQSFDWYKFIVKPNAPITSFNANASGGTGNINYYVSATRFSQQGIFGPEYTFDRTNIQSNIEAKLAKRIKIGVEITGRIQTNLSPPNGNGFNDDAGTIVMNNNNYGNPLYTIRKNRPTYQAYANGNPDYLNDTGVDLFIWNAGRYNNAISGNYSDVVRVLQTNFTAEYQLPVKGLSVNGMYSYYISDDLTQVHQLAASGYTYNYNTGAYNLTRQDNTGFDGRVNGKTLETVSQLQVKYDNTFGKHTIGATLISERIDHQDLNTNMYFDAAVNETNLLYLSEITGLGDALTESARVGYVGRLTYNYADRYYFEASCRRDASSSFPPGKRWGLFPSVSAGWRVTEENFFKSLGISNILSGFKVRASYGQLGDDNIGVDPFGYITGYNYPSGSFVDDGTFVNGIRDRGVAITNVSWIVGKMTDIGADFSLLNGKITGSMDYFYRKRTGLLATKTDILLPYELGYTLAQENLNSDANYGTDANLAYHGKTGAFNYMVGGNFSFSRRKTLEQYKPTYYNSWNYYRNSIENRYSSIQWGYICTGQFQSQDEINSCKVNQDNLGNRSLLPGDLIREDVNGDGVINSYDQRPIGFGGGQPIINFGLTLSVEFKGFDLAADFSGASVYTYYPRYTMEWPFSDGGGLMTFFENSWHRTDPFDVNSAWIPGRLPALRYSDNDQAGSNYNANTFWIKNISYFRNRTLEIGYTLPKSWIAKVNIQKCRVYVNTYNLFSIDNLGKNNVLDPENSEQSGLNYPQTINVNIGVNLTF